MTQGETKTELWHQCSVAEPKRWALWDEEGVLWTWGGLSLAPKSPEQAPAFGSHACSLSKGWVHGFQPRTQQGFPQGAGPQPLQDTTSKALAKEMFPAFQAPHPAGLHHPTGLRMEHEMGMSLSPGSQSSACPVAALPIGASTGEPHGAHYTPRPRTTSSFWRGRL